MALTRFPFRLTAIAQSTRLNTRPTHTALRASLTRNVLFPGLTRSYATPAKPKKGSIGETAKRGRPAAKKTSATQSKSTSTRKTATKAKPKKKTATASATQKAATKARKTAREKEKKAAAALRKREQAQKAREKAKAKSPAARVKLLKEQALEPPAVNGSSGWIVFWTAKARNEPEKMKNGGLTTAVKEATREYKSLSESERESYDRRAKEQRSRSEREYKDWVEQHTPEEIRQANLARAQLRRLKVRGSRKYSDIKDDRKLKRPATPYLLFSREQGSLTGPVSERAKESGRQWRQLSDSQKERYVREYAQARVQYDRDYERLYGSPPAGKSKKSSS